jgi:hypothetical protein
MALSQPNKAGSLTVWGRILLALLLLNGSGAIVGSIGVMRDALSFPDVWLQDTPFHSYFLPGLILFLTVGGSHLAAAYATLRRHLLAKTAAVFAGFLLTGWMIGELALIGFQAPIQVWFLSLGLLELTLSLHRSATPREQRGCTRSAELREMRRGAGISLMDSGRRCVYFQEVS